MPLVGHVFQATSNSKEKAQIYLREQSLSFQGEKYSGLWDASRCHFKFCGTNSSMCEIRNPKESSLILLVDSEELIANMASLEHPRFKKTVNQYKQKHRSLWLYAGIAFSLATIALVTLLVFRQGFLEWIAHTVPVSVDQFIAKHMAKSSDGSIIYNDQNLQKIWKPFVEKVIPENSAFNYQIFIRKDRSVNAFAYPGGFIQITEGLIRQAETREEIYGVIAHEIAHVEKRHGIEKLVYQLGILASAGLLFGDLEQGILLQHLDRLGNLDYSREKEEEADLYALSHLAQHGIPPSGLMEFFKRSLAKQNSSSSEASKAYWMEFLQTHPSHSKRIQKIQTWLEENPTPSLPSYEERSFDIFKRSLLQKFDG
jgi:predicted Zn-dependent protease